MRHARTGAGERRTRHLRSDLDRPRPGPMPACPNAPCLPAQMSSARGHLLSTPLLGRCSGKYREIPVGLVASGLKQLFLGEMNYTWPKHGPMQRAGEGRRPHAIIMGCSVQENVLICRSRNKVNNNFWIAYLLIPFPSRRRSLSFLLYDASRSPSPPGQKT